MKKTLLVATVVVALFTGFGACAPGGSGSGAQPGAGGTDPLRSVAVSSSVLQAVQLDESTFALAEAMSPGKSGQKGISVSFFSGHYGPVASGKAHWVNDDSDDNDPFSVELDVPEGLFAGFFSSFAGINFHHVPAAPPALPPSFDFQPDRGGDSGGSPRLVMMLSDGGNINLRPLTWLPFVWTSEGASQGGHYVDPLFGTNWDSVGGVCDGANNYELTYYAALACHPGTTVTAAFIVSDSGWLNAPYRNWIDNIQYNGTTISQPSDNSAAH